MSSSNTGKDKTKTEHLYCGTDKCCMQCDTAVIGDTPPLATQIHLSQKYTERDWNRTVGYGQVPKKYRKD